MREFKRGDYIKGLYGEEGYFVGTTLGQSIIERVDGYGWERKANSGLIPEDYVPIRGEGLFWAITLEYFELIEAAKVNYEIY